MNEDIMKGDLILCNFSCEYAYYFFGCHPVHLLLIKTQQQFLVYRVVYLPNAVKFSCSIINVHKENRESCIWLFL